MDSWKAVLRFYKEELGIPENVTEYLSVELILKYCAMGLSNNRISRKLKLDVIFISQMLSKYLNFEGWTTDLDFSPLAIYNRCDGNYVMYEQEIQMITYDFSHAHLDLSFSICRRYNSIRKEIDNYYGN